MSKAASLKKKLIILVALLALMGIFWIIQSRPDTDNQPTLTGEEIARLTDFELTRRMKIDHVARSWATDSTSAKLPPEILPVYKTITFEDTRSAIGFANAIPTAEIQQEVIAAYTELGAIAVANVIKDLSPGKPLPPNLDLALTNALTKANVEQLRLAWVREHAKAFSVR
jgi:hypothetical protein